MTRKSNTQIKQSRGGVSSGRNSQGRGTSVNRNRDISRDDSRSFAGTAGNQSRNSQNADRDSVSSDYHRGFYHGFHANRSGYDDRRREFNAGRGADFSPGDYREADRQDYQAEDEKYGQAAGGRDYYRDSQQSGDGNLGRNNNDRDYRERDETRVANRNSDSDLAYQTEDTTRFANAGQSGSRSSTRNGGKSLVKSGSRQKSSSRA